jgi:diguanylate cyclase (GGDEF)-like protein
MVSSELGAAMGVMRLATITNWAYGLTVFLALAAGTTMLLASKAQDDERAAVAQRYRLDQATSKIATEVTALSEQAREYVITSDPVHLARYRREAAALRSVEERVRGMEDVGASAEELSALSDAMHWADTLLDEQRQAIAAHERGDDDQARRILFGAGYDRELDRVANDIERFQYRLDQRTDAEITAATNVARVWKAISEVVLALTGLLVLCVLYFVFKLRVLRPVVRLSDVINRLAAQDYGVEPPKINQIDEIGDMAQAIRVFRENGLERQRLEAERNADLAMRSLLSRMTQRMQGCETIQALEQVVERFIPKIAPELAGRLYLLDDRRDALVETCSWLGPIHSRPEFPPTACWALQRSDLHRPRGASIDVPCDHLDHAEGTVDSICLPLIAQRTTLGLLYLEPRQEASGPATITEMYLKMLAENISLALGNLRLRDALREMAMGDALTGLANRRHLEAVLELRLDEARRLGRSISCLMVDVDHFKHFNDQFGHEAGDAVLRAMGDVLAHSTRESGVAFRYGGEEFLLLMPELSSELAMRRAEEIQAQVRAMRIEHGGRTLGPITASFGLASAPDHCAFDKLVQTADAALYRAKHAGRDQIVVADRRATDQQVA